MTHNNRKYANATALKVLLVITDSYTSAENWEFVVKFNPFSGRVVHQGNLCLLDKKFILKILITVMSLYVAVCIENVSNKIL